MDRNGDGVIDGGDLLSALSGSTADDAAAERTEDTDEVDAEDEADAPLFVNASVLDLGEKDALWRVRGDYAQTPDALLVLDTAMGDILVVDGTAWLAGAVHVFADTGIAGDAIPLVEARELFGSVDDLVLDGVLPELACHLENDGTTLWLVIDGQE